MATSVTPKMNPQQISPAELFKGPFGFAITYVFVTAVELNLFTAIDRGRNTVGKLAKETSCSPRLHRALKPSGRLVIAEMLPDEERQEATMPLLFAVNMLVNTDEGDTFTFSEYRQ